MSEELDLNEIRSSAEAGFVFSAITVLALLTQLEQAEQERDEWRGKFDEAETLRIADELAVARVRELIAKHESFGMNWVFNKNLQTALDGEPV